MFSQVYPFTPREVPQSHVLSQVTGPRSFLGVPQSQVLSQVTGSRSFLGVPQSQVLSQILSGQYPLPRFFPRSLAPGPFQGGWGTLQPGQDGLPHGQDRMGYSPQPCQDGLPKRSQNGVPTQGQQQSEHLVGCGWYASCVQAGELSCCAVYEGKGSLLKLKSPCHHCFEFSVSVWSFVYQVALSCPKTELNRV